MEDKTNEHIHIGVQATLFFYFIIYFIQLFQRLLHNCVVQFVELFGTVTRFVSHENWNIQLKIIYGKHNFVSLQFAVRVRSVFEPSSNFKRTATKHQMKEIWRENFDETGIVLKSRYYFRQFHLNWLAGTRGTEEEEV